MLRAPVESFSICWKIIVQQYIELKEKALEAFDYQTSLKARNQQVKYVKILEYYHASPLLEAIEKNRYSWEEAD